jgi:hypothetical protein
MAPANHTPFDSSCLLETHLYRLLDAELFAGDSTILVSHQVTGLSQSAKGHATAVDVGERA